MRHLWAVSAIIWGFAHCTACRAEGFPDGTLEDFKSEDFRTRETAQASLLEWSRKNPGIAMDRLFGLSQKADDPEVRERCLSVLRELIGDEYLKEGEGYIGIRMQDETGAIPGDPKPRSLIRILQVVPDSPAHAAGLKFNDLIAGLEDRVWRDGAASQPFMQIVKEFKPATRVTLRIVRDGKLMDVPVKLGRRPLYADNPFLDESQVDLEAAEKAAKEAYFRRWMDARRARD
jgi:predicted metalloprotease with PDZ domain